MMVYVGRTNIDIDDELIDRAMKLYGVRTKREAVDLALRALVGPAQGGSLRDLHGTGWDGDLEALRAGRPST
jgi:Arc/MetJ family transcription regulator